MATLADHGPAVAAGLAREIPDLPPRLPVIERVGTGHRIAFRGRFTLAAAGELWTDLRRQVAALERGDSLDLDMSGVDVMDGGTMALLAQIRTELARRGVIAEFTGARERTQELIGLYAGDIEPTPRRRRRHEGFIAQVGRATVELLEEIKGVLAFLGSVVRATVGLLREPRTGNWKSVFPTMERAGSDAVPIVLLINFLVGLVIAYQAAGQLEQFGADLYVADLVGKSMTREMGPLMTAIILCGRSGAAFAAELGTMKVNEEIDALRTMGFGPMRYLVLPRMLALILVMPLLTLLGVTVGILGGYAVAAYSLDVTPLAFSHRLQEALTLWDLLTGLIKSAAFAVAIALISCQQGFATTGGAEGVGRRTTSSVVIILFSIIVIDAGFTGIFKAFDL